MVFVPRRTLRLACCLLVCLLAACATAPRQPLQTVDLTPYREAVAAAEAAAAGTGSSLDCLARAREHLKAAGPLSQAATAVERQHALGLARLAQAEATCATLLVEREIAGATASASSGRASSEAEARAQKAEAEQRRLEERVALLQRHLDATETELIRSKARLKGVETRAEASAATAEARILMRRALEARGRTDALGLGQVSLDKAEDAIEKGNYGMAVFYAQQARDRAAELLRPASDPPHDRPPAKPRYAVAVSSANLRAAPGSTASLVARLKKGVAVEALALRGEWVQVRAGAQVGWVLRSLLE